MVCPDCNKETKGIKLNGKIFCTFCGALLKDPTEILENAYQHSAPAPQKEIPGKPEINKDSTENKYIKKHHRYRTDNSEYQILKSEPDPIDEPELEYPHDSLLTQKPDATVRVAAKDETATNLPLLSDATKDDIQEKKARNRNVLKSYLKQTSGVAEEGKRKKQKRANRKKRQILKSKVFWFVTIAVALLMAFVGLVYYVNNVAKNETKIITGLETKANFSYRRPETIPPGYVLSYLSDVGEGYVYYHYIFQTDRERFLSLRAEKTNLKSEQIPDTFIKDAGTNYSLITLDGIEFWQTKSQIYAIDEGVLYTFTQSGEIDSQSFLKYATENLL